MAENLLAELKVLNAAARIVRRRAKVLEPTLEPRIKDVQRPFAILSFLDA